jgi:hypothetical protein
MKWLWILWCSCIAATAETATPQMPIPNNYADSIKTRWLDKPISTSRYYGTTPVKGACCFRPDL